MPDITVDAKIERSFIICKIIKKNGNIIALTSLDVAFVNHETTYSPGLDFNAFVNTTLSGSDSQGYYLKTLNNIEINDMFDASIEIGFSGSENSGNVYSFFIGTVVSAVYEPSGFKMYIMPIAYSLKQGIGEFFSNVCRAEFGDVRCGMDKEKFSFKGSVISIDGRKILGNHSAASAGYFANGVILFADGSSFRIINDIGGVITIATEPEMSINVGDTYAITAGCDKSFQMCKNTFHNLINFRGEPFINT